MRPAGRHGGRPGGGRRHAVRPHRRCHAVARESAGDWAAAFARARRCRPTASLSSAATCGCRAAKRRRADALAARRIAAEPQRPDQDLVEYVTASPSTDDRGGLTMSPSSQITGDRRRRDPAGVSRDPDGSHASPNTADSRSTNARSPPQVVDPGGRLARHVHGPARRHDRQHRHPGDHHRPATRPSPRSPGCSTPTTWPWPLCSCRWADWPTAIGQKRVFIGGLVVFTLFSLALRLLAQHRVAHRLPRGPGASAAPPWRPSQLSILLGAFPKRQHGMPSASGARSAPWPPRSAPRSAACS